MNHKKLSQELFYQLTLKTFANFGYLKLQKELNIYELILICVEDENVENEPIKNSELANVYKFNIQELTDILIDHKEMFFEYFSIEIKNQKLYTMPMILPNHIPNLDGIAIFLFTISQVIITKILD